MPVRVIVTGSSWPLGRHTVAALEAGGHEVSGLDRVESKAAHRHIAADLTDLDMVVQLIGDVDAVVHAAAIPQSVGYEAADVFSTRVASTHKVVEAATLNHTVAGASGRADSQGRTGRPQRAG